MMENVLLILLSLPLSLSPLRSLSTIKTSFFNFFTSFYFLIGQKPGRYNFKILVALVLLSHERGRFRFRFRSRGGAIPGAGAGSGQCLLMSTSSRSRILQVVVMETPVQVVHLSMWTSMWLAMAAACCRQPWLLHAADIGDTGRMAR